MGVLIMNRADWLERASAAIDKWEASFGPYRPHPSLSVTDADFAAVFSDFCTRLENNYPYFHPTYAGQMLKPPHPAAIVGYLTAMMINPNNHALDAGPATAQMEKESIVQLAEMFGFGSHLGHLTSSGTIANLEALFVARELHPDRGVAYSADAHYTHGRMCQVLRMEGHKVPVDAYGRMDLDALETLLRTGRVGTVVLSAGTTGLGSVDSIHEALALRARYGVRLHIDAAYGGFFTLLAGAELPADDWRAIASCDSVVIDPHKHGLQPYGCGAVIFADPTVGRFYAHDSPYTYFTSQELHLGEISLECSRAGAAAAALWLTFQLLPPVREGLGAVLAATRNAASLWAKAIEHSPRLSLYQEPDLDIVTYLPRVESMSAIDEVAHRMLAEGMSDRESPIYLSTLRVSADDFAKRGRPVVRDRPDARILRSVLMKPEAEQHIEDLHTRVERLAADVVG
ncbi:pyridoxal phosphate-dependent decarboxylase family protein [Nonomuraea sp. NPDC048826]|uniref:pyridoxal phosphate-dependent decarboxylase family protein n=1 Tax=Nonomuraea sp. NPDC048826 TaxID=3364347 RepID=UPI00371F9A49